MSFRKDTMSFYEMTIVFIIFTLIALFLCCNSKSKVLCLFFFLWAVIFLVVIILNFKCFFNYYITINDVGVSCKKESKILWEYKWEEIAKFKKCTSLRWPAVGIVTYSASGNIEQFFLNDRKFQLCKTAQLALEKYGKMIEK